jgi:hypothetical protein
MITMRDASGVASIGALVLREAAGLTDIGEVHIRDASGLKELFSPTEGGGGAFTVDVTPDSFGARTSTFAGGVTTSEVVATPNGGTAPYSCLWERTDANPEEWTIISPASLVTTFRAAAVGPGDAHTATFTCTVTDANGHVVVSAAVGAYAINYGTPI